MLSLPFYCFAFLLVGATDAFTLSTPSIGSSTVSSRYGPCHQQQLTSHQSIKLGYLSRKPLRLSSTADATPSADDADDEEVEAGKMRVSEIKAELDMRGVAYADCFDKEALEQRLVDARLSGKANPALIDKFNKQRVRIFSNLVTSRLGRFLWSELKFIGFLTHVVSLIFSLHIKKTTR